MIILFFILRLMLRCFSFAVFVLFSFIAYRLLPLPQKRTLCGGLARYSNHADQSVELSCDNSMASHTTDESWVVPDLIEHMDRPTILMAAAAAIAIGTIDGARYRIHDEQHLPPSESKLNQLTTAVVTQYYSFPLIIIFRSN